MEKVNFVYNEAFFREDTTKMKLSLREETTKMMLSLKVSNNLKTSFVWAQKVLDTNSVISAREKPFALHSCRISLNFFSKTSFLLDFFFFFLATPWAALLACCLALAPPFGSNLIIFHQSCQ